VLACAARELVREVDYTLKTLSKNLLGQERTEVPSTGGAAQEAAEVTRPPDTRTRCSHSRSATA